jgi:DamX protein
MVTRALILLASQTQLVERLQHLIYLGSSLMVVFGEQGSGKSTIVELLANSLSDNVLCHFVSLNKNTQDDKIKEQLLISHFKAPLFNPQDPLLSSLLLLQENRAIKQSRVIIIDNAHFISNALLAELQFLVNNKEQVTTGELCILFFSNKSESGVFEHFIRSGQCEEFEIDALSGNEAKKLLLNTAEKLGIQAKKQGLAIDQSTLKSCLGNASKIVNLVQKKTVKNDELKQKPTGRKKYFSIANLFAIGLFVIIAGIGGYFYPHIMLAIQGEKRAHNATEVEKTLPIKKDKTEQIATAETNINLEQAEPLAGEWSDESLNSSNDEKIKDDARAIAYLDEDTELVFDGFVTQTVKKDDFISIPSSSSGVKRKTDIKKKPLSLITDEDVLLAIPATKYTLQLASMSSDRSFNAFVTRYKLPQPNVSVYQTWRKGKRWRVIVWGVFATHSQAQKAITSLPLLFKKRKAWVKQYKVIHKELKAKKQVKK